MKQYTVYGEATVILRAPRVICPKFSAEIVNYSAPEKRKIDARFVRGLRPPPQPPANTFATVRTFHKGFGTLECTYIAVLCSVY